MEEIIPVIDSLPTETAVAFAPACQPPAEPPIPLESLIKETNRSCSNGVPYTTYSIPKGATFETLDAEFRCSVVGERGESDLIACTGKPLFAFDLKICVPVELPELIIDSGRCSADAGFDETNQCCAPLPPEDAGCVIFTTGTTACGGG